MFLGYVGSSDDSEQHCGSQLTVGPAHGCDAALKSSQHAEDEAGGRFIRTLDLTGGMQNDGEVVGRRRHLVLHTQNQRCKDSLCELGVVRVHPVEVKRLYSIASQSGAIISVRLR